VLLNPASQITLLPTNYLTPPCSLPVNIVPLKCSPIHSWSSHQCNSITTLMSMSPQPFCCLWHHIDHCILLARLSSLFGLHGSVLNWFKSYLSSRSFRVRCNNTFSSFSTSSCGVPQGSVLGPLLLYVHYPFTTLIYPFSQPSPLCRRHPIFDFTRLTLTQALPTCKIPFSKSLPGCLPVS